MGVRRGTLGFVIKERVGPWAQKGEPVELFCTEPKGEELPCSGSEGGQLSEEKEEYGLSRRGRLGVARKERKTKNWFVDSAKKNKGVANLLEGEQRRGPGGTRKNEL